MSVGPALSPLQAIYARIPSSFWRHLGLQEHIATKLPDRVRELITAEEERSERLIGWVQLAIVATFGTLYLIAPRPEDAVGTIEPVPFVLTAYLAFTLVRIVAAYRGFLPGWLLVFSMVADVVLLYGLIWSFHIAYGQPAPFYLKVPTFAYIFVFISIRALRFDPRFVISQGIFAAIGWLAMVLFAVEQGGMDSVTRSFVDYMTGNRVLMGAEFDKIATIIAVTTILSLALYRARGTLVTAVREQAATQEMRRFFGAGVAEAITSADRAAMAGDATDRNAAIVMLDLRGFSGFAADRSPHEVVTALTLFHARVVPLIEREGGMVDKFLGDGVMATFGALSPRDDAAAAALRALTAIMSDRPAWEAQAKELGFPPLAINGAAVAGRVVAATLGSDARLEFTVIGAAANLAAKLEKHNKETGTAALTTEETVAEARRSGYMLDGRSLGLQEIPGVAHKVALVAVA